MFIESAFDFWNRSEHMKELHRQGRYKGTSKIGEWNKSDEKRNRMKAIRARNSKDKTSRGYGSEYHMRLANRELLFNKFQGTEGYLYLLKFPSSIKVGFSKNYEGRTSYLGGSIVNVVYGPTEDLADLEFDIFMEFMDYTQLDSTGSRYTEFMDKKILDMVIKFIDQRVSEDKKLKYVV